MEQKSLKNKIDACRSNLYFEICIWGCGFIANGIGWDALQMLGICPTCFCDNNPMMWGSTIKSGLVCRSPRELFESKDVLFLVLVEGEKVNDIVKQISGNTPSDVVTWDEIRFSDELVEAFYIKKAISIHDMADQDVTGTDVSYKFPILENPGKKRIAVYTCISGNYDAEAEHVYDTEMCDYYYVSDNPPHDGYGMKWIDLNGIIPRESLDPVRRARLCKILGCSMFSNYEYSLYVDGSMSIKDAMYEFVRYRITHNTWMSIYQHSKYDCLFTEGMVCVFERMDKEEVILNQMFGYLHEQMPSHYGLFETGILFRKHDAQMKRLMGKWWNEVVNHSCRDQLSLTYCLWKYGFSKGMVAPISGNIYDSILVKVRNHCKTKEY